MKRINKLLLLCAIVLLGVCILPDAALCAQDPSRILKEPDFDLYSVEASELDDWYATIVEIPDKSLKEALLADLGMSGGEITVFKMLYNLPDTLEYSHLDIKNLEGLQYAINVKKIYLGNNLISLTEQLEPIEDLYNLEVLDLSRNQLTEVPSFLFDMPSLKLLNMSDNLIAKVGEIGEDNVIEELYLERNELTSLPDLSNLSMLQTLSLSGNALESFPESIAGLTNLTALAIANNNLSVFPDMSAFENLTVINLEGNDLTSFPEGIEKLDKLLQIDISKNKISNVPEGIFSLPSLSAVFIGFNELTTIPDGFTNIESLHVLDVSMNKIDKEANATVIESLKDKLGETSFLYEMQYRTVSAEIVRDSESNQPLIRFKGIEYLEVPEGYLSIEKIELQRTIVGDEDSQPILITINPIKGDELQYIDYEADTEKTYRYDIKAYIHGVYLGDVVIDFETECSVDTSAMQDAVDEFELTAAMIVIIIVVIAILVLAAFVFISTSKKRKL